MTTYEVKIGVPIPPKPKIGGRNKTALRLAVEALPVGGMIECERTKQTVSAVTTWAALFGMKLVQRRLSTTTMGIWRTA